LSIKLQILLVGMILMRVNAFSQDTIYSKILKNAICELRPNSTIYYVDSSFNFYGPFSRFAKKKNVEGYSDLKNKQKTSIKFTRAELRDIDAQILKYSAKLWPINFIEKSVRLNNDSLKSLIKSNYTRYVLKENANIVHYYILSQPIFVRDSSVAIFRIAEMENYSAGYDYIIIYCKEDQQWVHKLTIYTGAW